MGIRQYDSTGNMSLNLRFSPNRPPIQTIAAINTRFCRMALTSDLAYDDAPLPKPSSVSLSDVNHGMEDAKADTRHRIANIATDDARYLPGLWDIAPNVAFGLLMVPITAQSMPLRPASTP